MGADAGGDAGEPVKEAGTIALDARARDDAALGPRSDGGVTRLDATVLACGEGACDPRDVGSCGALQVCVLADSPSCVAPTGRALEGEACDEALACAPGLACFAEGTEGGRCRRPCCDSSTSGCAMGERCAIGRLLVSGSTTRWGACRAPRTCDVLRATETCATGEACYVASGEGATDCMPAGTVVDGAPCEAPNDCAPGLVCVGVTRRTCSRICSVGAATCPAETSCRIYAYSPPGTGVCTEAGS